MDNDSHHHDRRRFSRVDFHHAIDLRNAQGTLYHGAFNDISLRGMLFWSDPLPAAGEELHGALPLGEEKMILAGTVVRSDPGSGAAIRFHDLDVESFSHLRRLVSLNMGDADRIDREFFSTL